MKKIKNSYFHILKKAISWNVRFMFYIIISVDCLLTWDRCGRSGRTWGGGGGPINNIKITLLCLVPLYIQNNNDITLSYCSTHKITMIYYFVILPYIQNNKDLLPVKMASPYLCPAICNSNCSLPLSCYLWLWLLPTFVLLSVIMTSPYLCPAICDNDCSLPLSCYLW
jgi:hypothetical protein